jgi:predicted ATPase/Tfp pilus assembly protein PilF
LAPIGHGWSYPADLDSRQVNLAPEPRAPLGGQSAADTTLMVGREQEIWQVKGLLRRRRLVTIVGPGGIGKSQLALQAGAECQDQYADGAWAVDLRAVGSGEQLLSAIAESLHVPPAADLGLKQRVKTFLRARSLLLLLDGFEHLRAEAELLDELLAANGGLHLLVTSTEPLRLRDEVLFQLAGLSVPPESQAGAIYGSAVELFRMLAERAAPGLLLTEADYAAIVRLCRALGGSPLGIQLAATRARSQSCDEIAAVLMQGISVLDAPVQGEAQPALSLRTMIDDFWAQLSAAERRALQLLSLFRGAFHGRAALQIADASPFFLDALVSRGYVTWLGTRRYSIHEVLRQYAAEHLAAAPELQEQGQERQSRYYAAFLQEKLPLLGADARTTADLSAELGSIQSAWRWAVTRGRVELVQQMVRGLAQLYDVKGLFLEAASLLADAQAHLQASPSAPGALDQATQLVLLNVLAERARFLVRQGSYGEAIALARTLTHQAQAAQAVEFEALGEYHRGGALWHQGLYEQAWNHVARATTLAAGAGLRSVEADGLRRLGRIAAEQGQYELARTFAERALSLSRDLGDRQREARNLNDLGIIADAQADYGLSRSCYTQCLELSRALNDVPGQGNALLNLGAGLLDQGAYAEAEQYLLQARAIIQQSGNQRDEGIVLENLGDLMLAQGAVERATIFYRQALNICRRIGDRYGESVMLLNLGRIHHQGADNDAAYQLLQEALSIAEAIGHRRAEGQILTALGQALAGLRALADAATMYRKALAVLQDLQVPQLVVGAQAGLAWVRLAGGDPARALSELEPVLAFLATATLDGVPDPLRLYFVAHQVLLANDDSRAQPILAAAYRLLQGRAEQLRSPEQRRAYIAAAPWHQEIARLAEQTSS